MLVMRKPKAVRIYKDISGVELQHGDKVVTIEMNSRAKGGDLVYAYVDLSDGFKLKKDLNDQYRAWGLYKTSPETKVLKV